MTNTPLIKLRKSFFLGDVFDWIKLLILLLFMVIRIFNLAINATKAVTSYTTVGQVDGLVLLRSSLDHSAVSFSSGCCSYRCHLLQFFRFKFSAKCRAEHFLRRVADAWTSKLTISFWSTLELIHNLCVRINSCEFLRRLDQLLPHDEPVR